MVHVDTSSGPIAFMPIGGTLQGHTNASTEFMCASEMDMQKYSDKMHAQPNEQLMLTTILQTPDAKVPKEVDISAFAYADDITQRHLFATCKAAGIAANTDPTLTCTFENCREKG